MSAYTDDSEAEYDDPSVILTRYSRALLSHALCSPDRYHRACQELAQVYRATSEGSPVRVKKAVLSVLISDTRLAIEHCDG